jgi:hypothetical protein
MLFRTGGATDGDQDGADRKNDKYRWGAGNGAAEAGARLKYALNGYLMIVKIPFLRAGHRSSDSGPIAYAGPVMTSWTVLLSSWI